MKMSGNYSYFLEEELITTVTDSIRWLIHAIFGAFRVIPGHQAIIQYFISSYKNDPFRVLLEGLLVVFTFKYLMAKRYSSSKAENEIQLTGEEIEDMIKEWKPQPLTPPPRPETVKDISGALSTRPKSADGHQLLNFASFNFLDLANNNQINEKAIRALRKYGVGSCGPPGFYGTLDIHLDLERRIAEFIGTESAILYAQGFSCVSSVIPAFSKRLDYIVCDDGVSFALQKGVQISRSHIRYYKHNDMEDLERVLTQQSLEEKSKRNPITRKFIVTEGLFTNFGDISPLPRLIELKKRFKYRLILDETNSIGSLGSRGAGLTDFFSVDPSEVDIICGSLSNAFASAGGFCAGSIHITDHQRLSGQAYCFSASMPALLAVAAKESIDFAYSSTSNRISRLHENIRHFRQEATKRIPKESRIGLYGSLESPLVHLRFKPTHRAEDPKKEEGALQEIVDYCYENGKILLTTAKYVENQELRPQYTTKYPSIRISISAGLSEKDIDAMVSKLAEAISLFECI